MTTPKTSPPEPYPRCAFRSDLKQLCLSLDFQPLDGRLYGFPYTHLLHYLCEKNPEVAAQAEAPSDRFSLAFSTHDVVLLGWRLAGLPPLIRQGRLATVIALPARYYGLSKDEPFISEISVSPAQKD